jgi:iron(III) transport system substrate-binding protein
MQFRHFLAAAVMLPAAALSHAQNGSLNLLCSVQDEWCSLMATTFGRVSGIKVNVLKRGTGEALAQLAAEKDNPKTDIWFGGTGDPHMQAGEQGLTLEYKSAALPQLYPWAQYQARHSGYRTVGVYSGPLSFAYNTELLAKKKTAPPLCWKDLLNPALRHEIQLANPNSSGTAYTMIATLVQLMGEDKAFDYLKALHPSVSQYTRSGTGPIKAVARGEASVSVSWFSDSPAEQAQGFPIRTSMPCEGTGAEIGSMSIIKGARNLDNAKKFYEWALTPGAQQFGAVAKQYQLPSNRSTKLDPLIPDFSKIKLIDYDYARYGKSAERKRLIERWEREVNSQR